MVDKMHIDLAPDWDQLEEIRLEAGRFLEQHGLAKSINQSTVMVLSELLENSIKYGSYSAGSDKVSVDLEYGRNQITVEVTNPINDSSLPDLDTLDRMIQWVRGFQDPFEAYVKRLREISIKPLDDRESSLGIGRIIYEGQVDLDFFVTDEDLLTVSAIRNLSTLSGEEYDQTKSV